jgi:two-component system response regulator RegA
VGVGGVPFLFVDDDEALGKQVASGLQAHGYEVYAALTVEEARRCLRQWSRPGPGAVDLQLPDGSGLDLVGEIAGRYPGMRLILTSAYCSIAVSVEAMRMGAVDCLQKPYTVETLIQHLNPVRQALAVDEVSLGRVEWEHIQRVLRDTGGNVSLAAVRLGIDRRSLQRKLQKRPPAR